MYEAFFGLGERPFHLTPNPRFLFLNPAHREALATLRYGLTSSLGITLLLGGAGTGKTTLLRAALQAEHRPEHRHAVLINPTLTPADFYEILADTFGLPGAAGSKGRFLLAFERDLLERHRAGGLTALVIDEAQSLTHDLFEEIRLLANLETDTAKLLNVVLVGQPELSDRLNAPSLRQFKQRVMLRCTLAPLDLDSTASYIASRLQVAGAAADEIFTREAVRAVYEASGGIPRTIGVVCENALLAGYSAHRKPVDRPLVLDACRDLDLDLDSHPRSRPPRADRADRAAPPGTPGTPGTGRAAPGRDLSAPRQDLAAPAEPALPDRRSRSRFWWSAPPDEPQAESAGDADARTSAVARPKRLFDFF
jgi:general secretion pathway protein A